jgi:alpha-glucosidase
MGQTTQTPSTVWWQTDIIYQIYPRSFKDSNGDGIGDLNGIIEKLDYLSDTLGVGAIWLSPFYPSPMADFGYDVADYTGIDPIFGDLADFDRLVQEAHRRGLKIIVDWVPNHSSDRHPWFIESRSSRTNPKRDWYVWRNPKPNGDPPNNWVSAFGGSAWEWDVSTGQYYLHSFLKEQPDLNWRNSELAEAMFNTVEFWLKREVDGFRIDVAQAILKDPEFRDNPLRTNEELSTHKPMGDYDSQIHLYDSSHEDTHLVYRQLRRLIDKYSVTRPRMTVGEVHIFDLEKWASYYGQDLDELHMPFNFGLLKANWQAQAVRQVVDNLEAHLPAGGWPNYVLSNHDEPRIASRLGVKVTRLAMLLLLTLRGTPTMYYGDELAMQNVEIEPDKVQDPWEKLTPGLGLGRDGERTPMQWDATPNAGFSPAGVTPWLPVAENYRQQNVAVELTQPASMLNFTRRLIALRQGSMALKAGSYQAVDGVPQTCFVYLRQSGSERYLVLLNFSEQPETIELPEGGRGRLALSTRLETFEEREVDLAKVNLEAGEGWLVKLAE